MSPFSQYLFELRMSRDMRQAELAERLGYEQSYISALEVGTKGPPTPEFVETLVAEMGMSGAERDDIRRIADASDRKIVLSADSPPDVYWMLNELREQLATLRPAQVKLIREALSLKDAFVARNPVPARRLKRRQRSGAQM